MAKQTYHKYVILGGKVYTVGRKDCDILITSDATISRKHAEISMSHAEINLGNVSKLPILMLKDVSKFGTYVNSQRVSGERILQDGDSVYFGSPKSPFMVVYEPLVVTTSCLDTASKKALKKHLCMMGGHMISEWKHDCSLLIMSKISVTVKVICALVSQKSVVTPNYLMDYLKYLQGKADKPDPDLHSPELAETQLDSSEVSFKPDARRKTVFKGMTFIFLNEKQMKKLSLAIELGGGTPLLLEEGGDDAVLLEKGTVVMTTVDTELSQAGGQWLGHVQDVLQRHDKHLLQDAEVGYAVLYCSTEKHCNPEYEPDKSLSKLPSQSLTQAEMFVPNTETQHRTDDTQRLRRENAGQLVVDETVLHSKQKQTSKAGSPEVPVFKVKKEPVSQSTPVRASRKRGREAEKEEVQDNSSSKRVKAEPVTPVSKHVSSTPKVTMATEDWGSDDDDFDYSTIDLTPAATSKRLRGASDVKEEHVSHSGKKPDSRSRSPAKDTATRASKTRSRSPAKVTETSDGSMKTRSRSPAKVSDTSTSGTKTRSRSPAKVSDTSETSNKTRSKSPAKVIDTRTSGTKTRSRSPANVSDISEISTKTRSRSPAKVIDTDAIGTKSRSRSPAKIDGAKQTSSKTGSHSPARIRDDVKSTTSSLRKRSRSRSPHHAPQNNIEDSDDNSAACQGSLRSTRDVKEKNNQRTKVKKEMDQPESTHMESVPEGFMSARNNQQVEIKQQDNGEGEDVLPSNCAVVDVVSLVVHKPRPAVSAAGACPDGHQRWRGKVVRNFKKFRKANNAGMHRLPTIIGGSDLEVHQGQRSKELDDWFSEAIQAESQTINEERRANALFDYDPRSKKRGK